MRIAVVVQARLGSRRLPGKILMDIAGRPLLAHVLARAKGIRGVDPWVVLAVPASDRAAISHALWGSVSHLGCGDLQKVLVFSCRASEGDVLGRYVAAARWAQADAVVRITADCPLLSAEASSLVVERFMVGDVDYASNVGPRNGWPDGWDTEVISAQTLEYLDRTVLAAFHREHVTTWLRSSAGQFRIADVRSPVDRSSEKLSVDTLDDLERVRRAFVAGLA